MIIPIYVIPVIKLFFDFSQKLRRFFQPEIEEDNIVAVVHKLLRKNRIKVTFTSIVEYVKTHPNYPYLNCICDFFNDMNILNYALKIEESDIFYLSKPFIAHVKDFGGKLVLVYSINKEYH